MDEGFITRKRPYGIKSITDVVGDLVNSFFGTLVEGSKRKRFREDSWGW